jgi:hypothetical protein
MCPALRHQACACDFGPKVISILFLNLIETNYTVREERALRRAIRAYEFGHGRPFRS